MTATAPSPTDRIMSRIEKLLELANNDGATEAEAALAMERVHEMLTSYNLSLSDIERTNKSLVTYDTSVFIDSLVWKRFIYTSICKLNYCRLYISPAPRNYKRLTIIGREHNILAAKSTASRIITILASIATKETRTHAFTKAEKIEYRNSFLLGASARIARRVKAILASESASPTTQALTVNFADENTNYAASLFGDKIKESKSTPSITSAYAYGRGYDSAADLILQDKGLIS